MKPMIWRTSGGDNSRRGLASFSLNLPVAKTGERKAGAGVTASPVFREDGTCFIADFAGNVYAYSPSGELIWHQSIQGGIQSTPALRDDDQILFIATFEGYVYALDTEKGSIAWQQEIPSESDPRILSDLLFLPRSKKLIVSGWGYKYFALDTNREGAIHQTWPAGSTLYAGASANLEETLYMLRARWSANQSEQGVELIETNAQTGDEKSLFFQPPGKKPLKFMKIASPPVLSTNERKIYYIINIDDRSFFCCHDLETNRMVWQRSFSRHLLTTPAILPDGTIAIADLKGQVLLLDPKSENHKIRYNTQTPYLLGSPVSDRQGKIFIGDIEGNVHCIQPNGEGTILFKTGRCIQGRPSFDPDGRLFVPCTDGIVYVLSEDR
jgi:outer membrane protein assembly factor BamB